MLASIGIMSSYKAAGGNEIKLVGADDASSGVLTVSHNFIVFGKFTAEASGTMTQFRFRAKTSGNVNIGIYTAHGVTGLPDVLLNSDVTTLGVIAGVNSLSFPSTSITSGTDYWLAYNTDTFDLVGTITVGGTTRYSALSFGTGFPNPAGGATGATWINLIAGWGS